MKVALLMTSLPVYRAHKKDLNGSSMDMLREQDRQLVDLSREYVRQGKTGTVLWDVHDAAYARFPVTVVQERLPHTIAF